MSYYYVQNTRTKEIFNKHKTFAGAVDIMKSHHNGRHNFEMIATEIHDCHTPETRLYNNEDLYKVIDVSGDYIELDGGRWIRSCGDGRYYLNGNDNVKFAAVCINCYDNNGDFIHGEPIGYVQV